MKIQIINNVIIILFLLLGYQATTAQVNEQDSLTLVALYNSTNGDNWINNENWLTGKVSSWFGITNTNNRVTKIELRDNNLAGSITNEISDLTGLTYLYLDRNNLEGGVPNEIISLVNLKRLYIYFNQISDLPDLSSLDSLTWLEVQYNKLTFEDIEPNLAIETLHYSHQDSVGETLDTNITVGSTITLELNVGGSSNNYQWKKDNSIISGETENSITIDGFEAMDAGRYNCEITNNIVPDLVFIQQNN